MNPRIETINDKKLVGMRLTMSLAGNKTAELWRSFMPQRKEVKNNLNTDLISMQVYSPQPDFINFNPNIPFEKWAAVEVSDFNLVPDGMETYILPGGQYAVFAYKGLSTGDKIFRYIFTTWLPASQYILDNRPHFEILGGKYKNNDPDSEEEIWIPIKVKE